AAQAARELLAFVSGKSTASVIVDRDLYASEAIEKKLNDSLARMIAGEPLAYILGQWSFYGLDLTVTPDVLIPRDDTMAVTDLAISALRNMPAPQRVLDLCTGSGCIGLAIAHQISTARVTLADISPAALKVAKKNLTDLKLTGRVTTFEVDVRQPAPKFLGQFDLIVSNPPYVTRQEMQELEPSVRFYEPHLALDGGEDGLDFYRDILENYTQSLKPGGKICFEFGMMQHMAVGTLLAEAGLTQIHFAKDYRGVIRAVIAEK
ncbi:MAG: peptide chain release factor N(5)-glutamine methyltransferase, partial [Clostridia bacterium]|nr:peptide chain release factor N(5)-glutamine methyltransferase [Clostridia bacterium]